jgi:hypothetical protein
MLVFLVVAVSLLPMIVRFVSGMEPHFVVSGFQDMKTYQEQQAQQAPQVPQVQDIQPPTSAPQLPSWRPDPATDYICRSPNDSDQPCPEGTFCDGASQSCVPQFVGGEVPSVGYFS